MGELTVEAEPAEVGLDAGRLARLDRHFARYVDDGRLPGWSVLVSRRGRVAHLSTYGMRDVEAGLPVEVDTLWRVYSMTKAVTSVAAMALFEEGAFGLHDEVSRYIPGFAGARVWQGGTPTAPRTVPALEPVRIWHLLSHTAGLTYGFMHEHPVDAMYRAAGSELIQPPELDLAGLCELWAAQPLLYEPGTQWSYSVATDVLGRVLEVVAGATLDRVLADRVLDPLGMTGTGWWVPAADVDRLAALYVPLPGTMRAVRADQLGRLAHEPPTHWSGGGGLVSTVADYHRFTQALLRGGELDGVRLLGPRTLAMMTGNHLPAGRDLASFGRGQWVDPFYRGVGFGLGFAVVVDPVLGRGLSSPGEYSWGGAASTTYWVDPVEQLTCVFMTQLLPSRTHPIREQLRQLVNQAIVD
jgi:CubicO group peptidase (beta-lactamase class C family)